MNPCNSRGPAGGRPNWAVNHSRANTVRASPATCRGTVAVAARPWTARQAASRWPSSVSNAVGALAYTAYRFPSFAPVTGFSPAPNSNFICSAVTTSPADTPNPARPVPCQWPGVSPFAV